MFDNFIIFSIKSSEQNLKFSGWANDNAYL
jgi:hypothetical protein